MKQQIKVEVRAGRHQNRVDFLSAGNYRVYTTAPAHDNQANEAVIKLVATYLKIPKSTLVISRGRRAKQKILTIL